MPFIIAGAKIAVSPRVPKKFIAFLETNTNGSNAKFDRYASGNRSDHRDLATGEYKTTDGQPLQPDGSNGLLLILKNDDPVVLPTIGFIVEF